jgi:hypothetical protein
LLVYLRLKEEASTGREVRRFRRAEKKKRLICGLYGRQLERLYLCWVLLGNNMEMLAEKEKEQCRMRSLGHENRNRALIQFAHNQMVSAELAFRKL